MRPNVKAKTVIGAIMRNALAHGNIATRRAGREINDIMFLSMYRERPTFRTFRFVAVEPEDLRKFMMNYFKFLCHLDLGRERLVGKAPEAI